MTDSLFGDEPLISTDAETSTASSSTVLARKYRPAQFSDVVGQTHIIRTLMNAIQLKRLHQAYLFTGTRGTGKTSIARIFSKVLRCENTQLKDGFLLSCDRCASCREITDSRSVDVLEIDGASNNGVEAIREIRENAKFMPASGSRKIYIIDEVHMLTTAAFNALLKTLEEPPAHVTFIFATTEPHKIPATILSRVQRFDFRRASLAQIQARLAKILEMEKVTFEKGALALVAKAAEGSMRDSLSLLDQVIAFSGNHLTVQSVQESVGLVENQVLHEIIQSIFERNPQPALQQLEKIYADGHDLRVLAKNLIELLHTVILAKVGVKNSASLQISQDEWDAVSNLAKLRELEEIELIFQALHYGMDWIARSPQPKIVFDILLIKCATARALIEVPSGSSGAAGSVTGSGISQGAASSPAKFASPQVNSSASPLPRISSESPTPAAPQSPAEKIRESLKQAPSPVPAAIAKPKPVETPTAAPAKRVFENPSWEKFTSFVRETRPLLASVLEHGDCIQLPTAEDKTLVLGFHAKEIYYREQVQARSYHDLLMQFLREYFGAGTQLKIQESQSTESLAAKKERNAKERDRQAREAAHNHPILKEARALFGGELGPIETLGDTNE